MAYRIDWMQRCVFVRYSGDCSEIEVLRAVGELQSDYRFDSTYEALHDFRQCRSLSPSPEHLEELAARNVGAALSNSRLRIAVVASSPEVLAMVDRFNGLGLSPYPLRVFDNEQSALAWLEKAPACI